MSEDKIKERIYGILLTKYRSLFSKIYHEARSKSEHGKDENKIDLLADIGNLEKYSHRGIINKEDIAVVNALESCLSDNRSPLEGAK